MSTPTATPTVSSLFIQAIEDGLIAQLTAAFTNAGDSRPWLKVEPWPTRAEGYRLTGAGDVFALFKGVRLDSTDSSSVHYSGEVEFEITLRARTLRDQQAAYQMIDTAFSAIAGQRLANSAGVTRVLRSDFVDYAEGVFAYALVVAVPVFILQPAQDAPGAWLEPGEEGALARTLSFLQQGSST